MVCTFIWRQNIWHVGTKVVVCGLHGHHATMAQWSYVGVYNKWWDKLADVIVKYGVRFLCGEFNTSLTQVVPELRNRGVTSHSSRPHPSRKAPVVLRFLCCDFMFFLLCVRAHARTRTHTHARTQARTHIAKYASITKSSNDCILRTWA